MDLFTFYFLRLGFKLFIFRFFWFFSCFWCLLFWFFSLSGFLCLFEKVVVRVDIIIFFLQRCKQACTSFTLELTYSSQHDLLCRLNLFWLHCLGSILGGILVTISLALLHFAHLDRQSLVWRHHTNRVSISSLVVAHVWNGDIGVLRLVIRLILTWIAVMHWHGLVICFLKELAFFMLSQVFRCLLLYFVFNIQDFIYVLHATMMSGCCNLILLIFTFDWLWLWVT